MCSHLVRRGAVYHTRLVVPVRLRSIVGKSDLGCSLRTKDQAEAKRLLGPWLTHARATIQAAEAELARRHAVATPHSAKAIVQQRHAEAREREQLEVDEEWQAEQERLDNERNARIEAQKEYAKRLRIRVTGSTADIAPEDAVIARLLREHEADAAFWKQIANDREFALSQLRAEGVATDSQGNGMPPALPTLPKFTIASQRLSEGKSKGRQQDKGIYLDEYILDGWAAERKPSVGGKAMYQRDAKLYYTLMGRKSVELITKADVMAYKRKLIADLKRSQVNVRDWSGGHGTGARRGSGVGRMAAATDDSYDSQSGLRVLHPICGCATPTSEGNSLDRIWAASEASVEFGHLDMDPLDEPVLEMTGAFAAMVTTGKTVFTNLHVVDASPKRPCCLP